MLRIIYFARRKISCAGSKNKIFSKQSFRIRESYQIDTQWKDPVVHEKKKGLKKTLPPSIRTEEEKNEEKYCN